MCHVGQCIRSRITWCLRLSSACWHHWQQQRRKPYVSAAMAMLTSATRTGAAAAPVLRSCRRRQGRPQRGDDEEEEYGMGRADSKVLARSGVRSGACEGGRSRGCPTSFQKHFRRLCVGTVFPDNGAHVFLRRHSGNTWSGRFCVQPKGESTHAFVGRPSCHTICLIDAGRKRIASDASSVCIPRSAPDERARRCMPCTWFGASPRQSSSCRMDRQACAPQRASCRTKRIRTASTWTRTHESGEPLRPGPSFPWRAQTDTSRRETLQVPKRIQRACAVWRTSSCASASELRSGGFQ